MYDRLLKIDPSIRKSFFLLGPRGTGKTAWVKQHYPNSVYVDLLDSGIHADLLAKPKRIEEMIPPKYEGPIVVDEVQRIPELLNEVHRLIESKGHFFVLTGSSARKLRREGVNLLAGRALQYRMHPLTAKELGASFNLEKSLEFGHMPAVFSEAQPLKFLQAYLQTYLREEILQEGILRQLGPFARFLEAASFSQGSTLNVTEVARECAVDRRVVESYFQILEDLLIGIRLRPFTKRATRRLVQHPKFYFFDTGVYRAVRPGGPLDKPEEIGGASFETLFFQELRAINDYFELGYELYFWRTANGQEVDFVAYGPKGIVAFEVKRSRQIRRSELSGLRAFQDDYPMAKAIFIYGGDRREYHEKISAIPMAEALPMLKDLLNV